MKENSLENEITKEEVLKKHCAANDNHSDKTPELFTRWLIYNAMEEYATLKTSQLKEQLEEARKSIEALKKANENQGEQNC